MPEKKSKSAPSSAQAIVMIGNMNIGYKYIGPLTVEQASKFCSEIKQKQDPEISHAPLVIIPLFSPAEARREIRERGHLCSSQWLCIPRNIRKMNDKFDKFLKELIKKANHRKIKNK